MQCTSCKLYLIFTGIKRKFLILVFGILLDWLVSVILDFRDCSTNGATLKNFQTQNYRCQFTCVELVWV